MKVYFLYIWYSIFGWPKGFAKGSPIRDIVEKIKKGKYKTK